MSTTIGQPSNTLLAATRKGLFQVDRGPSGWSIAKVHFLAENFALAMVDPRDGAWYATIDHGHFGTKLHRSDDAGATWEEIGVPAYPEHPEGTHDLDDFGRPIPWKLNKIWALTPGLPSQPGRIWAGTLPGGLFRSDDRGATWSLVESLWFMNERKKWTGGGADLPGMHSVLVDPRDGKVMVAVSSGGVWESADDGATWASRCKGLRADYAPPELVEDPSSQDPHCVVRSPADPDRLYMQHHNGIFVSRNNAASWTEITGVSPSVFGFPVAAHPFEADTAWFVPAVKDMERIPKDAKVVVNRTKDGCGSFETFSKGLPQEHAYDLVYRHALDVDGSGARLAFGSSTGSLWVSEDGGESWSTIGEHLPPVYAVRFVK